MTPTDGEFELLAPAEGDDVGDEWEQIDVSDTEADRIARARDREFDQWQERIKDDDQFKVEASVFDDATFGALYKLVQDGYVDAFGGPVATGKEANVYEAVRYLDDGDESVDAGGPGRAGESESVAVKVYRINASDFRDMRGYLEGDPRFEGIGSDKKQVVTAWVRKEFANLNRARAAGVRVPEPLATERNVLVMEYLGLDERARRLSEVTVENPETAFEVVREYMCRLHEAGLVHGDLSEYNLVVHDDELSLIDLGQAVTVYHPNADEYLERDCENVASFFAGLGVEVTPETLLEYVRENADADSADGDSAGSADGDNAGSANGDNAGSADADTTSQ